MQKDPSARIVNVKQWGDFFLVAGISLVMALLAGLWPSWEASNLKPMEIIRYT